jgi:hypothetical protein
LESQAFDTEFWPEISRNANWLRDLLRPLGPLDAMELLEHSTQNGRRLYRYRLKFPRITMWYAVILTKEGRISALRLQPQ